MSKESKIIAYFCGCPMGGHLTGCLFRERMRIKYEEHTDWDEDQIDAEMIKRFGKLGGYKDG